MFIHAMRTCDTVSTIYRQVKLSIRCTKQAYDLMDTFIDSGSTHGEVKRAGEDLILQIYGASSFESLDDYRHIAYIRAIGRSYQSLSFQFNTKSTSK